ncbi:MAG: DUF2089 domain-containing protein [Candidatus Omnitrophota bacterium]
MRVNQCPFCHGHYRIKKLECTQCGVSVEGDLHTSPMMSLTEDQQQFIELFVLSSGSLKEMAQVLGVTYPTVRARLDQIIEKLRNEIKGRDDYKQELLEKVEAGKITPEKAAQIIKGL